LIDADASRDSAVKADAATTARIRAAFGAQERKLDETKPPSARSETNQTLLGTTDPDAPCISQGPSSGATRPRYKHHPMVDDRFAEPAQLAPLREQYEAHPGKEVTAVVADRGYGTAETYGAPVEQGVRPPMPPMPPAGHRSEGLFTKDDFRYDEPNNVYICPAAHRLKPRRFLQRRQTSDYVADRKVCAACPLRAECTHSQSGRSVARHWKEKALEVALAFTRLPEAQADRRRRRHLMEGSFAHAANRYQFKRSRWRRLWHQQIQDRRIAAVQNSALLCGADGIGAGAPRPRKPVASAAAVALGLRSIETDAHRVFTLSMPGNLFYRPRLKAAQEESVLAVSLEKIGL
jgi:Transposase DDE domain